MPAERNVKTILIVFLACAAFAFSASPALAASPQPFLSNLQAGSNSADVIRLQSFLNAQGFAVATSGPGSLGNETSYFGSLTRKAVSSFQEAHAADILIPNGYSRGTGNFFAATRAFANSQVLLASMTTSTPSTAVIHPARFFEQPYSRPAEVHAESSLGGGQAPTTKLVFGRRKRFRPIRNSDAAEQRH